MITMPLDEARKILGEEMSAKFTDDELQQIIGDLEVLARMAIKQIIVRQAI